MISWHGKSVEAAAYGPLRRCRVLPPARRCWRVRGRREGAWKEKTCAGPVGRKEAGRRSGCGLGNPWAPRREQRVLLRSHQPCPTASKKVPAGRRVKGDPVWNLAEEEKEADRFLQRLPWGGGAARGGGGQSGLSASRVGEGGLVRLLEACADLTFVWVGLISNIERRAVLAAKFVVGGAEKIRKREVSSAVADSKKEGRLLFRYGICDLYTILCYAVFMSIMLIIILT